MSVQLITEGTGVGKTCPKCGNGSVFSDYKYKFTLSLKDRFHTLDYVIHTCKMNDCNYHEKINCQ